MRKFFAVALFLSVIAVTSVAYAFASDHSPGVQHELVMKMTTHFDVTPFVMFDRPGTESITFEVAPVSNTGVIPEVMPRCNSPGNS